MKLLVWLCPILAAAQSLPPGGIPVSVGGGATATYQAVGSGSNSAAGTSIPNFTVTIPGGVTNGAVACGVSFSVNTVSAISVTIGGSAASVVTGSDSSTVKTYRSVIYGRVTGSTTGAQTVAITWTGSASATAGCVAASGVNQTTPFAHGTYASGQNDGAGGGNPSLAITSAANNMTMNTVSVDSGGAPTAPTQTSRFAFNDGLYAVGTGGSTAAGAATVTHAWTVGNYATWTASGADFQHN